MIYFYMAVCMVLGVIVDHFFLSRQCKKLNGELIFKTINEDEAKVEIKLYEDCLYDTINAKKAVFKVIRE